MPPANKRLLQRPNRVDKLAHAHCTRQEVFLILKYHVIAEILARCCAPRLTECDFLPAVIIFQVFALGFRADKLAALGHNQNIGVVLDKAVDCDKADDVYGGRLPVHVRCLLDEFANIGQIPKFEKLIATIRSREISASIILQSQSQLKAIYKDNADTIVGNCDTTLFLGGKEKTTLKEMSEILGKETIDSFNTSETRGRELSHGLNYQKLGKQLMSEDEIAVMDGGKCILQLRGVRPFFSEKYDITKHPKYKYLSDFDKKNAFDMEKHLRRRPAIVKPDEVFDYYEVDEADLQEDTE